MSLLKAEIQKITGVKWFAAVLAALIFASSLVCFFYVSGGERSSYTPEQVETIKEFAAEFSVDSDGLVVFKQSCTNARRAIMMRLGEEYEKELEAGADEKELEKKYEAIYTDPSTFLTHVFSDKIDDASLITAYERLNAVKSDFDYGVDLILRQSERNAAELRTEYGMTPDDPLYQYQIYAYNKYKAVSDSVTVGEEFVFGWDKLFSFSYGDIFLFFALILLVGTLYFVERNSGMTPLLRVSKYGRAKTALSKICAAALISVVLTLLFSFLSFLVVGLRCGYSDPSAAIQNVKSLALFPETWSIGGFYCYFILLKSLAAIAFTAMLSVFASVIVTEPLYYLSGAALFGVHFILNSIGVQNDQIFRLNIYSLSSVIPVTERLYIFQPLTSCFGYHIIAPILCVVLFAVSSAASVAIGNSVFSLRSGRNVLSVWISRIKRKSYQAFAAKKEKNYRRDVSLLRWEARKLFCQKSAVMIMILMALFQIGISVAARIQSEPDRQQRIYARFVLPEIEGPYSQNGEKFEWLLKIYTDPNDGSKKLDEATASGLFSEQDRARIADTARFIYENDLTDGFAYSEEVYDRNTRLHDEGLDPIFIDETAALPVVTNRLAYPLYFAVLIICLLVWTVEYGGKSQGSHFANIMTAAKNGRSSTVKAKTCFVLLTAFALTAVFCFIETLILLAGKSTDFLGVPLYSVSAYSESGIETHVGLYLLILFFIRMVSSALLGLLSLSVSALTKNFTAAFSIVAGATLIPTLLFRAGLDFAGYVSFIDFQSGNGMIMFSIEKHLFGNYYGAFLTYFVIVAILTIAVTVAANFKNGEKRT